MGLEFLSIKDRHGSSIFLIYDGTERDKAKFERLAQDVGRRTKKQIIVLSIKDKDAIEIIKFYSLKGNNFALIVRDDDQLHHAWSNGHAFDASQIAYMADQAG